MNQWYALTDRMTGEPMRDGFRALCYNRYRSGGSVAPQLLIIPYRRGRYDYGFATPYSFATNRSSPVLWSRPH